MVGAVPPLALSAYGRAMFWGTGTLLALTYLALFYACAAGIGGIVVGAFVKRGGWVFGVGIGATLGALGSLASLGLSMYSRP